MPTIQVSGVDAKTGAVIEQPVTADGSTWELTVQPLPGASAIHLLVRVDQASVRAEISLENEDPVPVSIAWSDARGVLVSSGRRRVFTLPADDRFAPAAPLRPRTDTRKLDLLFLIDGTTQFAVMPAERSGDPFLALLLDPTRDAEIADRRPAKSRVQTWKGYVDSLVQFSDTLRERYPDLHSNVVAFGDESADSILNAPDLHCAYAIHPEAVDQRRLKALSTPQLRDSFTRLPATSGGDYVDALAEALPLCADAGWRKDARRILVLFGDSPGFSLAYPPPKSVFGVDIHIREKDVDTEAMKLHAENQVEIVTIYAGSPADSRAYGMSRCHPLLEYTAEQYARLASLRTWAWRASTFEAATAAESVLSPPPLLGRQSCAGILTEGA